LKASSALRLQQKKIKNAVFQAQKKAARELVQVLIDVIRTRARLLGEFADGTKIAAKELSDKYIQARKRYANRLDPDTTPETSNATATGQMLNSMKGKAAGTKITIDLKTGRRKELNGSKSRLTNSQVNQYYEEEKGEWFGLQEKEKEEAIDYATEIIKEEIKKVLK
jgi:hypothetical protein